MKPITVTLTDAQVNALIAASCQYDAEQEGIGYRDQQQAAESRALDNAIRKIVHARNEAAR